MNDFCCNSEKKYQKVIKYKTLRVRNLLYVLCLKLTASTRQRFNAVSAAPLYSQGMNGTPTLHPEKH